MPVSYQETLGGSLHFLLVSSLPCECPLPETPSQPMEDQGGEGGWPQPSVLTFSREQVVTSQASFSPKGLYSGWFTAAAGERSLPAALLSTTPFLSRNPGHQMAQAGCLFGAMETCSFLFLSFWVRHRAGTQPQSNGAIADFIIHNPRALDWVIPWLYSPEQLIPVTIETPLFPLRSWD